MNIFEQIEQEVRKQARDIAIQSARNRAYFAKIDLRTHDYVLPTFSEEQLERIAVAAEEDALQRLCSKLLGFALDDKTE